MANSSFTTPGSGPAGTAAITREVGDDMVAIFGPGLRGNAPMAATEVRQRPRPRRRALAALAVGGVVATIAAGVVTGRSALSPPAVAVVSGTIDGNPTVARRPAVAPTFRMAVAGPADALPSPASMPGTIGSPAPGSVAVRETPPPSPLASAPASPPAFLAGRGSIPPPNSPAAPPVSLGSAARQPVAVVAAAPPQAGCSGDDDTCLDARLDAAEHDMADAYAEASDAGVRARILRGYRNEWLRTRGAVGDQPREALRLYAMMTSDLHNLVEDTAAQAVRR